ncbi:uncharacterized protein [Vicugna pacos]|uniref:Uncharacterized protein n=1 Tax=Vicugna pacos TaxID=30538 RepID=A0ABM5D777_VICPA
MKRVDVLPAFTELPVCEAEQPSSAQQCAHSCRPRAPPAGRGRARSPYRTGRPRPPHPAGPASASRSTDSGAAAPGRTRGPPRAGAPARERRRRGPASAWGGESETLKLETSTEREHVCGWAGEMDSLEVALHGQCRARPSLGRVLLCHHLHQTGVQVLQLLMESSAEFVQEGGVPGSRGALCVEEVEDLLEHLVEDRDGLGLLELAAIHLP